MWQTNSCMVLNSLRRVCSTQFSVVRYLKHSFKCAVKYGLCQPISKQQEVIYTRRSVSSDIPTPKECYIKHGRECFLSNPNIERVIHKHEKACFLWYSNTEKVIYHTSEWVFYLIFKHRKSEISNVRRSFSYHIKTLKECYITHEKKCLLWSSNTEKVIYHTSEWVFYLIFQH